MKTFEGLGTAPVKCELCDYEDPAELVTHLKTEHKDVAIADYVLEGGRLWNARGLQDNPALRSALPPPKPRKREQVEAAKAFGRESEIDPKTNKPIPLTMADAQFTFGRIVKRTKHVPRGNKNYVFPTKQTCDLIMLLQRKLGTGNHAYIAGPSGTGKTELVEAVADKMNWPLTRFDCDSHLTRDALVGSWVVRGRETVFQYGLVPIALAEGHILLINEYDTLSPHVANILKSVLDRRPRIVLHENGGEVIHAHPDFRVVATANTWARGDDSGLFPNTHLQSVADLRRFGGFIEMTYMEPSVEQRLLIESVGEDENGELLDTTEAEWLVTVANKTREAYKANKIDRSLSPAELVNWGHTYHHEGYTVYDAARLAFLNSYPDQIRVAVMQMVETVFTPEKAK